MDVSEFAVDSLSESLDCCRVNVPIILVRDDALSVVLVFHFHSGELADVHDVAIVLASSESLGDTHVQIESLVCFVLAVRDASLLLGSLCKRELAFHAVLVTLSEKELWKCGGKQRLALMARVLGPI